eukprot:GEMP01053925.1.p1 GENE.GEMP01053925.1~~GEMP01053925.1.p1  ORF type:complete len:166 (+),score=48.19 GEMP01053925.1:172-669(+)
MGEVQEVFKLFDVDGEGTIKIREIATVLRSLGYAPPESVLNEMTAEAKQLDQYNRGTVTEALFVTFVDKAKEYNKATEGDASKELDGLRNGILHFFEGVSSKELKSGNLTSMISIKVLERVMASVGEKMIDREMEEFLTELRKHCKVEGDKVDFNDFKKMLLSPS